MSDRGAPASTSAAETTKVRGVAFGWANVAVSITIPAISAVPARRRRVERHPDPQRPAGRPSRRWPPRLGRSNRYRPLVVRGVVVDDHPGQPLEQLGVTLATAPTRSSVPQSEITSRS